MYLHLSAIAVMAVFTSGAIAQEPEVARARRAAAAEQQEQLETVVFSLSSPARDVTRMVMQIYADQRGVQLYPESNGHLVVVRVRPDLKDEVIKLLSELDRPAPTIITEIQLLQATESEIEFEGDVPLAEQVAALTRDGRLTTLDRIKMSGLENVPQSVQCGRTIRQQIGAAGVGGRNLVNYQHVEVGTSVGLIARVTDNGDILADLEFTKSWSDDDDNGLVATTEVRSSLRLADGVPTLVNAVSNRETGTWLLVTARVPSDQRRNAAQPVAPVRSRPARATTPDRRYVVYFGALLKRYDLDGDGKLSRDEFSKMERYSSEEGVDADGDGFVTVEELVEFTLRSR